MVNRENILNEAYKACMTEMYLKAQPSADFNKLLEDVKAGKLEDSQECPLYSRYYLSYDEFNYIKDKYIKAYRIKEEFTDNINIVKDYFDGKGHKDVWIPAEKREDGYIKPGYRSIAEVPHIKTVISDILKEYNNEDDECVNKITHKIFQYLEDCQDFYRFDREENSFNYSICLGCSPTSNKKSVIEYWAKQGININIEDRNPLLFWDKDEYEDEFIDVMIDSYGENWEEITWNQYYETDDGKKNLVSEWLNNDNNFKDYYVCRNDNDELVVSKFNDTEFIEILIDDFIDKHQIKKEKH